MLINIDTKLCEEKGIPLNVFFFLLYLKYGKGGEIKEAARNGWAHYFGSIENPSSYNIDNQGLELIDDIIGNSGDKPISDDDFESLAEELKELYPKGKKPGTIYMWRDSTKIIANKLKVLVKKYNLAGKRDKKGNLIFTKENVLDATRRYIASFNGDYTYMQLLKYFILKKDLTKEEEISQLLSYLENEDDNTPNNSWMDNVRYDNKEENEDIELTIDSWVNTDGES